MPRGYWISCYREVRDHAKLASYALLAGPAIAAGGGRFLARGGPVQAFEAGVQERTVLIEFDSVAAATAAYESDAYKAALRACFGGADAARALQSAAGPAQAAMDRADAGLDSDG